MNRHDIENIEPKELLYWFKKICEIPHGSYHEKQISDWLTKTFKDLGCQEVIQYPSGMILARLAATKGYEKRTMSLLQGHMDMVLAKTSDCKKDLVKEHIDVFYNAEKDQIQADKTTLGGDNGVAVAAMLAIAANKKIAHGPLEMLITVNEEDIPGKCIVDDLKTSDIKSSLYFNLDGENVNSIIYGSAGCITGKYDNPVKYVPNNGLVTFDVEVTGLKGGHSGVAIHNPHINGIVFLAEALINYINHYKTQANIVNFTGGPINNAIPVFAKATVQIEEKYTAQFEDYLRRALNLAKKIAQGTEPKVSISINRLENVADHMLSAEESRRIYSLLTLAPNDVFMMEKDFKCMYSSSNLGFVDINDKDKTFKIDFKIRGFIDNDVDRNAHRFSNFMEIMGYPNHVDSGRCWSFVNEPDANIAAQTWAQAYKKVMGKDITFELCAGGLELTDVCKKKPELMAQSISVGATVLGPHSPAEAIPVKDLAEFWKVLVQVLKTIN